MLSTNEMTLYTCKPAEFQLYFANYKDRLLFHNSSFIIGASLTSFSLADQNRYLCCKQCRSRWVGSGSILFAILIFFYFRPKPLFASVDISKFKDGRVHLRNSGMKQLKESLFPEKATLWRVVSRFFFFKMCIKIIPFWICHWISGLCTLIQMYILISSNHTADSS